MAEDALNMSPTIRIDLMETGFGQRTKDIGSAWRSVLPPTSQPQVQSARRPVGILRSESRTTTQLRQLAAPSRTKVQRSAVPLLGVAMVRPDCIKALKLGLGLFQFENHSLWGPRSSRLVYQ